MKMKGELGVAAICVVILLLITTGCDRSTMRVGSLQTKSESVALGDARAVDVVIEMALGELAIAGSANELLEADFTFNVAELEPEVAFTNGTLQVRTPDVAIDGFDALRNLNDFRNEWRLRLNDEVPMEMEITIGAGNGNLVLGTLSLSSLKLNTGAGNVTLDLAGSDSLTRLTAEAGIGELTVDLNGRWRTDLDAAIKAGVGDLTVRLPADVGVRVDVTGGIGDTRAPGLRKEGDSYVNDAYGESEVTLRIDIESGIGGVNLLVGE